ncbi:hypothetical protein [Winogradskyella sp. 3972H.M.0a.05]|uniref:hypothetical protein n=1 Tax=Winogradskyella sp. 3972H.M.0a.05 TaxID=2950277 RepID=UPI0033932793
MSKTSFNKFNKWLNNNWIITIFSTMFGIIAGLYINDYFQNKALLESKQDAMVQVLRELDDNHSALEDYHNTLKTKYEAFDVVINYISNDLELLVPADTLDAFLSQVKPIFTLEAQEPLPGDLLRLRGDMDMNITSKLVAARLTDIIWNSFKETNYMSVTSFECLTGIESIYHAQDEVNKINAEWKSVFFRGEFLTNPTLTKSFMSQWNDLLLKQGLLLKMYELRESFIINCE